MSGETERPERASRATGTPRRARTHLNYGEAIERQRRERGMTREALAEASGVSASYLSEVERGFKRPSTDVLARVAEALGQSPSGMLAYVEVLSEALPAAMPAGMPEALPEATREAPSGEPIEEPDLSHVASMRIESPRMESPGTRREWAASRFGAEPAISPHQAPPPPGPAMQPTAPQPQRPERGSLRALLTVLEYLSEDDLRILLALARRLTGRGR